MLKGIELEVLRNGVRVFPLEVENDFEEAQDILNESEYTDIFEAECIYTEREAIEFLGTYEVKIERKNDYERFLDMLKRDGDCFDIRRKKVDKMYLRGLVTARDWEKIYTKYRYESCDCSKCTFKPTFEEWKSGKVQDGKRIQKLGKTLKKLGFPQFVIDFYSQQIKNEETMYITISDRVQHITGMSYYAEMGSWDGAGGTSCQDPRQGYEQCEQLGATIHDKKTYIAMLHADKDDILDMNGKLLARSMMKEITFEGRKFLLATNYYGNNVTKNCLHQGLNQLNEVGIYSIDRREYEFNYDEVFNHSETTNESLKIDIYDDVEIEFEDDFEIECECPVCEGSGKFEVYSYKLDGHVEVDCPTCGGSGEYSTYIYIHESEWVEVEVEKEIEIYAEGYQSFDGYFRIAINGNRLERDIKKYNR